MLNDYVDLKYMPIDNGYKYLCNIMDIFSRYAFGDAIKEKDENSVLNVIKKYVSLLGAPAQIQTVSLIMITVVTF